jgi:hypothetical protein
MPALREVGVIQVSFLIIEDLITWDSRLVWLRAGKMPALQALDMI